MRGFSAGRAAVAVGVGGGIMQGRKAERNMVLFSWRLSPLGAYSLRIEVPDGFVAEARLVYEARWAAVGELIPSPPVTSRTGAALTATPDRGVRVCLPQGLDLGFQCRSCSRTAASDLASDGMTTSRVPVAGVRLLEVQSNMLLADAISVHGGCRALGCAYVALDALPSQFNELRVGSVARLN